MKVDIITSNTKAITFDDLRVGDTFYDYDGEIAIKTDNVSDESRFNGICFEGCSWFPVRYSLSDEVTPVNSILKVGTDT